MTDTQFEKDIRTCVNTYMWIQRSQNAGHSIRHDVVLKALRNRVLREYSSEAIGSVFANISAILQERSELWVEQYAPQALNGNAFRTQIKACVNDYRKTRDKTRVEWLIPPIPKSCVVDAVNQLGNGVSFDYPESRKYDVVADVASLPPKKVVGYAARLHYGAPLLSGDFSAGDGKNCFTKIRESGFEITLQNTNFNVGPEHPSFRKRVKKARKKWKSLNQPPPKGNINPRKRKATASEYQRDPEVVAWVEQYANGKCELCNSPAPFVRPGHHIWRCITLSRFPRTGLIQVETP